jgi:hypothetical protein
VVLMALQGPIPVAFGHVFPYGAFAVGAVEPVRDFDRSSASKFVQENDKNTGEPVWSLMVLDADPEARAASKTVKVKITAQVQPILPEAPAGVPFVPVEFEGMAVMPWVNDSGRMAYSFRAKGITAPKGMSKAASAGKAPA